MFLTREQVSLETEKSVNAERAIMILLRRKQFSEVFPFYLMAIEVYRVRMVLHSQQR